MNDAVTIRTATRRDVAGILAIEERFPEPWTKAMVLDELSQPATRSYRVAIDQGRIVGCLGLMFVLDEAHVNTIGVLATHEGVGVASRLLADGLTTCRVRGATRVSLEVATGNERAQALYRRYGFAPVGIRRGYYQRTNEDALVYVLELNDTGRNTPTL